MKKKSCLIFMVFVGILLWGHSAQAEEVTNSGIKYLLNEKDNICYVSGHDASTMSSEVSIPETISKNDKSYKVVGIGYRAFKDCKNLKSISIPEGLKEIDIEAFYGCSSLEKIAIPSTTDRIDQTSFKLCDNLTEIKVDENNESYYDLEGVLFYDSSVSTVDGKGNRDVRILMCYPGGKMGDTFKLESDMVCAESNPFMNNHNLKSIVVDPNNESYLSQDGVLYEKVFLSYQNRMTTWLYACPAGKTGKVSILDGVETIYLDAFYGSYASEIIIPDSVTSARPSAFAGCSNLEKLTIGKGFNDVNHALEFSSYKKLNSIVVSAENKNYAVMDGILYNKEGTKIIYCPKSVTSATVSSDVTAISEDAFVNCADSLIFTEFVSYKKVNAIAVSPENKTFTVIDGILYNKEGTKIIYCPKSVTSATVSSAVTAISENAFINCSDSLVLTVEKNSFIFKYAESNGIKYIIKSQNVGEVVPPPTEAESILPSVGTTKTVSAGTYKVTKSSAKQKEAAYLKPINKTKTSITIPASVNIDGYTYKVTSIAPNAFANNKKLTKITVGKNVTSIGKNAFKNCKKLKSVTLKSTSLKTIGSNAFYGDKNLKTITIKSSKLTSKSVGKNAFKGTNKKLTIKVPKKKVSSYKKFLKKKGNKKITVKKG